MNCTRILKVYHGGQGKPKRFLIKTRAGDANPGPLIRRRRRDVYLVINIHDFGKDNLTLTLRLPYDLKLLFDQIYLLFQRFWFLE
jgi:hypothetical protein